MTNFLSNRQGAFGQYSELSEGGSDLWKICWEIGKTDFIFVFFPLILINNHIWKEIQEIQ